MMDRHSVAGQRELPGDRAPDATRSPGDEYRSPGVMIAHVPAQLPCGPGGQYAGMVGFGFGLAGCTFTRTGLPFFSSLFSLGFGVSARQIRRSISADWHVSYCLRRLATNCCATARLPVSARRSSWAARTVMPETGISVGWYNEYSEIPSTLSFIPRKIATLPESLPT